MDYHGLAYEDGFLARSAGQMMISMRENHLLEANGSDYLQDDPENWRQGRETSPMPFSDETVLSDAAALFFNACGVNDVSDTTAPVEHGAIPLDGAWNTPTNCFFLFHRDPREFALDFGRIYAHHHFGIEMPELLDSGVNVWSDDLHDVFLYLQKNPRPDWDSVYKNAYGAPFGEQIIRFLERLDEPTAKQLESRPEEVVRSLRDLGKTDSPIKVYDFGDRGMALVSKQSFERTANSKVCLWQAYMFIMENVIRKL